MKKYVTGITICGVGMLSLVVSYICKKRIPHMPIKEFTKNCLYMAVLDDEICRNELEGNFVGGEEIVFPSRPDSLQFRYHLFLDSYRAYTRKQIFNEIKRLEQRVIASRKFANQEKQNLTVISQKTM